MFEPIFPLYAISGLLLFISFFSLYYFNKFFNNKKLLGPLEYFLYFIINVSLIYITIPISFMAVIFVGWILFIQTKTISIESLTIIVFIDIIMLFLTFRLLLMFGSSFIKNSYKRYDTLALDIERKYIILSIITIIPFIILLFILPIKNTKETIEIESKHTQQSK